MNEQVFILLNDKIDAVEKKVDKISENVDQMLAFKWQIIGGSVVVSLIAGFAVQVLLVVFSK